jgi:transcriptional regulator with XRE-family HTH domain
MSQIELAARFGISAKTLSRWEYGERVPTRAQALDIVHQLAPMRPPRLAELARALGVEAPADPAAPDPSAARIIDEAVWRTAEELDVSAQLVRRALAGVLARVGDVTILSR